MSFSIFKSHWQIRAEEFETSGGIVNGTCTKERSIHTGPPLFQNGNLVFEAHDVGWIVCAFFSIVATICSFWLIGKHLKWYTNKREQRFIVRILFMVPIYAWVSFASYIFWNHATPLLLLRDMYESTVLTSFFYLLLVYLSPDASGQRDIMLHDGLSREHDAELRRKGQPPAKWAFPLNWVKWKPEDGLYFFQIMKWGVLQYCVLRPLTTLGAVILDYMGLYCEKSYSPAWGHIYLTAIVSVSVTIAMYCLLQLYFAVSERLKPKQPLLKLFAIKAVVFLTFWQATGLGFLITFDVIKNTQYMTADDINTGIGAILETFEMMVFAFVHVKAFSYRPYKPAVVRGVQPQPSRKWRSFMHAMDFRETARELWAGSLYMAHRARGIEPEGDRLARRQAMLAAVMGQDRALPPVPGARTARTRQDANSLQVRIDKDEDMYDINGERQWLGVEDARRGRREKSEGLEEQIEKELRKKGYSLRKEPTSHASHQGGRSTWWRRVYDRLSQTGSDAHYQDQRNADENLLPTHTYRPRSRSRPSRHRARDSNLPLMTTYEYDDPPPPSIIRQHESASHVHSGPLRLPVWSQQIVSYEQRQGLSPTSPRYDRPFSMPSSPISHSDPTRTQPLSPIRQMFADASIVPTSSSSSPRHSSSRDRRWTFGADGPLNALAAPDSPRSSHESDFHTARGTLASETSLASSFGSTNEFGYRSKSRRLPAEHTPPLIEGPHRDGKPLDELPPPHLSPSLGPALLPRPASNIPIGRTREIPPEHHANESRSVRPAPPHRQMLRQIQLPSPLSPQNTASPRDVQSRHPHARPDRPSNTPYLSP